MRTIETTRSYLEHNDEIATRIYEVYGKLCKLVKVYDEPEYKEEYKDFMKLMHYLENDLVFRELVHPQEIIRCKEYDRVRMGYTMEYLQNQYSLSQALYMESLETKKEYFNRIATILKKINKNNMAYDDIHGENILIDQYTDEIKFIDPDSLKVLNINTNNLSYYELREKLHFCQIVLSSIYDIEMSFNCYYPMSEKIKNLEVTPELREYIYTIEHDENPELLITDFKKDLERDVVRFNKKITDRRRHY